MDFERFINELIELEGKIEPNFDNFDNAINNLNGIILKINKMKNICKNKIIFIGRCGSMKNELILNLVKLKLSKVSISKIKDKYIEYISENNKYGILVDDKTEPIEFESVDLLDKYIQSNYSTFSSHIKIFYPKSLNEILKDKIMMDTPFYDYSDERDDEIVNNCRDGQIFIVVLDAVEAIGYRDKKFLKRLSEINFIKLIFIFNCMEQVSKENYDRTKGQHTANATRISNEILIPQQENIPIFFIENSQINEEDLQCLMTNTNFNEKTMQVFVEGIKQEMKKTDNMITLKIRKIDNIVSQKEKEFDDYEEQRKKADGENRINEKKNTHINKLQKMICNFVDIELEINKNFQNSIDLYIGFLEEKSNVIASKEASEYTKENVESGWTKFYGILSKTIHNLMKLFKTNNPEDEKWETLKNELSQQIKSRDIIDKTLQEKLSKFIVDHNKLVKQTSTAEGNNCHTKIKLKDQTKYNADITKNENKEISNLVEQILNEIKTFSASGSNFTYLFKYFQNILEYLNNILKGDSPEFSIENILDNSESIKLINTIELIEIATVHDLLKIILLIKILLKKLIEQEKNKPYQSQSCFSKYQMNTYDHLKAISENMKRFDNIKQIQFLRYEIITKYSKSKSDLLNSDISQYRKKIKILEKAKKLFNKNLDKII